MVGALKSHVNEQNKNIKELGKLTDPNTLNTLLRNWAEANKNEGAEYVKNHLPVIPVKTELVIKWSNNKEHKDC